MECIFSSFRSFTWITRIAVLSWLLSAPSVTGAAEAGPGHHIHGESAVPQKHGIEAGPAQPPSGQPAPADSAGEEASPTTPTLSLEQLEAMALESNPTLAQAAAQVQAAAGRTLQAGLYPNPSLGYRGEEISRNASGGEHGGFVQQTIITAGKLGLSRTVFQREQVQAEELAKAQRMRVLIANFTWVRPEIECRGESCIRPAPRPHWAITRIAPTEEDACN